MKKNKRVNSDSVVAKKSKIGKTAKSNPFEVHLNKERFTILGKKVKHGKGEPGVSRGKAFQKRKQTLGQEYNELHKKNKFKDNRIAKGVFSEDAANVRFAAEKVRQLKERKRDLYNLNDEEVLTHRGQTLEEIEQFEDDRSDDSADEILDAEFTGTAHFGGDGPLKSRTEAIEDIIAENKRRKAEIAKEKADVFDLTQKLDAKYKSVLPLIGKLTKTNGPSEQRRDDYNKIMREMIFEPRGEVTDRLKLQEEIIKEEKERLEKLERGRLARMNMPDENQAVTHRSADALDDGFYLDVGENEQTLIYDKEGTSLQVWFEKSSESENTNGNVNVEDDVEGISNEEDSDEESEEVDEDNMSDLKYDTSSEEDLQQQNSNNEQKSKTKKKVSEPVTELPYVFDLPDSYDNFYELLVKHTPQNQSVIIDKMLKCNHPKLEAGNRLKMANFFLFLLQYIADTFDDVNNSSVKKAFQIYGHVMPFLFTVAHFNVEKSSFSVLEIIKEKYGDYKKQTALFPNLQTVVYFKLVSNLFSASDFRHPVVTPTFVFMSHILSRARVKNRKDLALGLFISTIALECTMVSKRFLPAVLNFLLGTVFLSVPKKTIEVFKIVPPFMSSGPFSNLLVLDENLSQCKMDEHLLSTDFVIESIDNNFKIRALNVSLKLANDILRELHDNVGVCYLAEPYKKYLEKINFNNYPNFLRENHEKLEKSIEAALTKPLSRLVPPDKKPKSLRMYDPLIKTEIHVKKRPQLSKKKEIQAILQHKIKRETKGAVREIRRDNAFLSKLKIKKRIERDTERKEKVQRIYAEAAMQQGELNSLERKKRNL